MASFQTNLTKQVIDEVREFFKEKVFTAVIPRSVKLSEAPSFGKPAVIYDSHNRGSQAYVQLSIEFLNRFGSDLSVSSQSSEVTSGMQPVDNEQSTSEESQQASN